MLKSEFTERTGYNPDYDEYEIIEQAYYESEKDKNGFCEEWLRKQMSGAWEIERPIWKKFMEREFTDSRIIHERNVEIDALHEEIERLKRELKEAKDSWLEFAV